MNIITIATISAITIIVAIVFLFLPLKNLKKFTTHLNLPLCGEHTLTFDYR